MDKDIKKKILQFSDEFKNTITNTMLVDGEFPFYSLDVNDANHLISVLEEIEKLTKKSK